MIIFTYKSLKNVCRFTILGILITTRLLPKCLHKVQQLQCMAASGPLLKLKRDTAMEGNYSGKLKFQETKVLRYNHARRRHVLLHSADRRIIFTSLTGTNIIHIFDENSAIS